VQLRRKVVDPPGEARSDAEIVFGLATRLGLGAHFWEGDVDAGHRFRLQACGLTLEDLRDHPEGIRLPIATRFRKFADERDGVPAGFGTPTHKIEVYSQTLLEHGYPPVPEFEEPRMSPRSRPDLAERYPLILTSAKPHLFCETQHRGLPSLRRKAMDPELELHPAAAAERGIDPGDWVRIETPHGSVRARARLNDTLRQDVIVGQHGWWQACQELDAPGYDPLGPEGANLNLIVANDAVDPVSGSVPHRAYLAQVRRVDDGPDRH
jgi:anaerobic selenocysteine-containing dehydrogenase